MCEDNKNYMKINPRRRPSNSVKLCSCISNNCTATWLYGILAIAMRNRHPSTNVFPSGHRWRHVRRRPAGCCPGDGQDPSPPPVAHPGQPPPPFGSFRLCPTCSWLRPTSITFGSTRLVQLWWVSTKYAHVKYWTVVTHHVYIVFYQWNCVHSCTKLFMCMLCFLSTYFLTGW